MINRGTVLTVILIIGLAVIFFSTEKDKEGREAPKAVAGLEAPEFFLKDESGNAFNSAELNDTVVFINFWASWCQPCRDEMPSIQGLYNRFRDNKKFRLITILYKDDYQSAAKYLKENKFDLPVFIDPDAKTARAYGVTGVPETYIINKKGVLLKKFKGPSDWNAPDVIAALTQEVNMQ